MARMKLKEVIKGIKGIENGKMVKRIGQMSFFEE